MATMNKEGVGKHKQQSCTNCNAHVKGAKKYQSQIFGCEFNHDQWKLYMAKRHNIWNHISDRC